eukprot:755413-Hanusia_phi.AAC.8
MSSCTQCQVSWHDPPDISILFPFVIFGGSRASTRPSFQSPSDGHWVLSLYHVHNPALRHKLEA